METSIEMVLTNDLYFKDEMNSIEGMEAFIDGFASLENGAKEGRAGFVKFLTAMQELPKLERDFNSANKHMQTELEKLLGNIDQTIAMSSRAQLLGNSLLNKLNEKPE